MRRQPRCAIVARCRRNGGVRLCHIKIKTMRTILFIVTWSFCLQAIQAQNQFWIDAKINGKPARLSLDTGAAGQTISFFQPATERLGIKLQANPTTAAGQIPYGVTERCRVKLRWSFWRVTHAVGELGVI